MSGSECSESVLGSQLKLECLCLERERNFYRDRCHKLVLEKQAESNRAVCAEVRAKQEYMRGVQAVNRAMKTEIYTSLSAYAPRPIRRIRASIFP